VALKERSRSDVTAVEIGRPYPRRMNGIPRQVRLLSAQARVAAGLAVAYDPPLVGAAVRAVVGTPHVEESDVGGIPATIFRPGRGLGPWPAVLVYPGVTREGRRHAAFVGLGRALAAVGFVAVVTEPDGLARGELTGETVDQALAAADALRSRSDVAGERLALAGVSGGATLALVAAEAAELASRVTAVAALAPVCDIAEAVRFVSTGFFRRGDELVRFETRDFLRLVCARSLVASLTPGAARDALLDLLRSLPDYGDDPLASLRAIPPDTLDPSVRTTVELLVERDPVAFDERLAAVPSEARRSLARLSAGAEAGAIEAPVELIVGRADKYVPLHDARVFADRCRMARLTVLDSLGHVVPRLSIEAARDLLRLNTALVRFLAASYSR
jgi:pimeloyl-ACP methyl ester carboxylesterase